MNQSFDYELLDKYIAGNTSAAELSRLKSQFPDLESFEREVQLQKHLLAGIQSAGNRQAIAGLVTGIEQELEEEGFYEERTATTGIRSSILQVEKELEEEGFFEREHKRLEEKTKAPSKIKQLYYWGKRTAVAAVLLVFSLALLFNHASPDNALAQGIEEEQEEIPLALNQLEDEMELYSFGGPNPKLLETLHKGIGSYQKANFKEAENHLITFLNWYPLEKRANFYLGLCYLKLKNYQKAHTIFSKKDFFNENKDTALWFNALCLVKLDRKQESRPILRQIAEGNSPYWFKARIMLILHI